jgi:hypothetical protein
MGKIQGSAPIGYGIRRNAYATVPGIQVNAKDPNDCSQSGISMAPKQVLCWVHGKCTASKIGRIIHGR